MHEVVEHTLDHPEVVMTFILLFHVHEIFGEGLEAARHDSANVEAKSRVALHRVVGVIHNVENTRLEGAAGGGVRFLEECGHFAKHGTRFACDGDSHAVLDDFHGTFGEEKELPGGGALFDDGLARRIAARRVFLDLLQNGRHG